ncbi:endonuclease V isoform X3 [Phoenix dactylifera]|nr:endonuclease V isoform X3 [Phoenix dactylifera]XP_038983959.1 endonuclease V isoform X3 [Phoenix dactylifera]XP_038983960.1 endonuclease V isoform X3 [Phoenix dactylifera]XP_038983970.1 endonuclease V isoform X3 [Phoenix dactylifera]XP_038983971.1 endonuclease V isoform X3 [Phoenix dactylifera]
MILPFEKMEAPSRCADRIGLSIPLPLIPNLTLLMNGWCFCCSKDLQSLLVFILVLLTSYLACRAQDLLKGKLIVEDDFTWIIPSHDSSSLEGFKTEKLKYIGGVDISFLKEDPSTACAALVILDADTLNVVHEEFDVTKLQIPYVPGFLAFREAPILLGLLDKLKHNAHPFYPQLLMVDGNGLLHPRGFGLACHLGVLANLPTIGIGKNLHHVDGLTQSCVRQCLEARENCDKDLIPLIGKSGNIWGVAMRSSPSSSKPIYISTGHRISLNSAIRIVKLSCKFRVPEPIRQADIKSKVFLQKFKGSAHLMK